MTKKVLNALLITGLSFVLLYVIFLMGSLAMHLWGGYGMIGFVFIIAFLYALAREYNLL